MQATPQGFRQIAEFDTKDGVYDCAWSEASFLYALLDVSDRAAPDRLNRPPGQL